MTDVQVLQDYFPATATIDGRDLKLRIARFTLEQYTEFMRDFARSGRILKRDELVLRPYKRPKLNPLTGQPILVEDKTTGEKVPILDDDETAFARMELEETPEDRQRREARDAEDVAFSQRFLVDAISNYITVEPKQLASDDGPITTGARLLRFYVARQDVLQQLLGLIYMENALSDDTKKKLRARSTSATTSTPSINPVAGDAPAPTAVPALPLGSVPNDDAMVSPADSQFGAMTT